MKNENKFTPGPWEVSGESITAGAICIAVIETDGGYEAPIEHRAGNAALIASAPALAAENARLAGGLASMQAKANSLAVEICGLRDALRQIANQGGDHLTGEDCAENAHAVLAGKGGE
jgi:hypothetical protein